ncbi:MAG: hypothetical protein IPJ06_11750 [Saprospiraceae bacterium]|nr:hypothetical protein [Saprospiraceae bacterium]
MRKSEGAFKEDTTIFDPLVRHYETSQIETNILGGFHMCEPRVCQPGRAASRTGIIDLSLFKSLNMRMYMLIVSLILLGGWHVTAQTPPTTTPIVQPDESWVLKDYPQAKKHSLASREEGSHV